MTARGLAFGRSGTQDATPLAPYLLEDQSGRMGRCEKESAVLLVLDQAQADLGGPELTCPDCSGRLRRWASPGPVRCAPVVVDACGYDRDGSAAPAAG